MTRIVTGPARATNALLLGIAVGTAVTLGAAAQQLPTTLVGLGAVGASLLSLRAFAATTPVRTVVGSALTLLAAVGYGALVLFAPLLAYEAYKDEPGIAMVLVTTFLSTLTPWLTTGAAVCVLTVTTDDLHRDAVSTGLESLLTSLVVVGAGLLAFLSSREGVLAFGPLVTRVVGAARRVETHSQLSELGTLAVLLALVTGLAVAVSSLPRYEYARARLGALVLSLWTDAADTADGVRDDHAGPASRLRRGLVPLVVLLWGEGLALLSIGAVQDPGTTVVATLPGRLETLGQFLATVATAGWLRAAAAWVAVTLALLGVSHRVVTRLIHVPWKRYQSRVVQTTVPALVVGAGVVFGPTTVQTLEETPSLHYVSVALPNGQTPRFTPDGIVLVEAPPGASGLYRSSEGFLEMLRFVVDLVGTPPLVVTPVLGLAFLGTWVIFAGHYAARPVIARVSSAPVLAGWLLFGSALAAAILGVAAPVVLLAGIGAVVTWDLQGVSRRLADQLDPAAKTIRGELIRAGGTGLVLALGAAVAVAGVGATQSLATVNARPSWQLLLVQISAVAGTAIALVVLTYRRH